MPLTNAERQRLYRERHKKGSAHVRKIFKIDDPDPEFLTEEEFRRICARGLPAEIIRKLETLVKKK